MTKRHCSVKRREGRSTRHVVGQARRGLTKEVQNLRWELRKAPRVSRGLSDFSYENAPGDRPVFLLTHVKKKTEKRDERSLGKIEKRIEFHSRDAATSSTSPRGACLAHDRRNDARQRDSWEGTPLSELAGVQPEMDGAAI